MNECIVFGIVNRFGLVIPEGLLGDERFFFEDARMYVTDN